MRYLLITAAVLTSIAASSSAMAEAGGGVVSSTPDFASYQAATAGHVASQKVSVTGTGVVYDSFLARNAQAAFEIQDALQNSNNH